MAKALKRQWDASNAGRVLVCDFYGFAQFRCGDEIFEDSYIYPSFPLDMLRMCIRKIEEGALISEWFCDEEIRYEVSEKVVNGVERLFIRWNDLGNVNHCEEFPGYVFSAFATKIADDIEADYFGWAYFMGSCDGIGISEDLESLKECVAKLRSLLLSVKS